MQYPTSTDDFRQALILAFKLTQYTQYQVSKMYGVPQGCISTFINGKRGMTIDSMFKLFPFVYEHAGIGRK